MKEDQELNAAHPKGESGSGRAEVLETDISLDTFGGKVQFRWAPDAGVSSMGPRPFFIEFLKTSGLFEEWVKDCPLKYGSGNAPQKRDVLGTILRAVLAGHWRSAHRSALRGAGFRSTGPIPDKHGWSLLPQTWTWTRPCRRCTDTRKKRSWATTGRSLDARRTPIPVISSPTCGW
jgi:hypothetical protein